MQALALEMAEQAPGSEVVASRTSRGSVYPGTPAHIASGPERNKGWLGEFRSSMGCPLTCHFHDQFSERSRIRRSHPLVAFRSRRDMRRSTWINRTSASRLAILQIPEPVSAISNASACIVL